MIEANVDWLTGRESICSPLSFFFFSIPRASLIRRRRESRRLSTSPLGNGSAAAFNGLRVFRVYAGNRYGVINTGVRTLKPRAYIEHRRDRCFLYSNCRGAADAILLRLNGAPPLWQFQTQRGGDAEKFLPGRCFPWNSIGVEREML